MKTPDTELRLRLRHPDYQKFLDHNESESERVREEYECHLDQKFGNEELQTLDVFPSNVTNSPILIFIHGGYWRALDKRSYSFIAEPFIRNNMTVCVVNYRLIPTVNMSGVLTDIKKAIHWIQKHASSFNGNPDAITLSGHSAGGHLSLMTYIDDEDLRSSIQSICSLSGIFDLGPIKESYLNEVLQLDEKAVNDFSVSNKDLSILKCPVLLSVGLGETNFFVEQSKSLYIENEFLDTLTYYEFPELNHYQMAHELAVEGSFLAQFILKNCG